MYTFIVSLLYMRNSWYKSISANITMRWISMRNLTLFDYAFVRNHMHCSVITIRSISMCISTLSNFPWVKNSYVLHYALFSASLCIVQLSLCEVSVCTSWHCLIFHRWRTLMCFIMYFFSYHYKKYQYVHSCTVWFSMSEELVCALYALF